MTEPQWLLLAVACFGGAMSPGPSLALVLRHGVQSTAAGLRCSWAHACGVAIYASLAVTGLAVMLQQHVAVEMGLSLLGALWLAHLARTSWPQAALPPRSNDALQAAWRDGLSMGLVNPKVALFFLVLFSAALPVDASALARGQAVVTAFAIDGLWYSAVVLGLQRFGLQSRLQKHTVWLARGSSLILAVFAVVLLWRLWSLASA